MARLEAEPPSTPKNARFEFLPLLLRRRHLHSPRWFTLELDECMWELAMVETLHLDASDHVLEVRLDAL